MVWSPLLKRQLALATVERGYERPGTPVEIEVTVEYERRRARSTVAALPFFDPPRKTGDSGAALSSAGAAAYRDERPPAPASALTLPARFYTDPDLFAREAERIHRTMWTAVRPQRRGRRPQAPGAASRSPEIR